MADALVSLVVEKLGSVLQQEVTLFAGARHELQKLNETFQSIQAVLADAESKQVAERPVQLWLSRLRGISYDISDVLDEWGLTSNEVSDDDEDVDGNRKALVPACLPSPYACLDHTVSRFKVAHHIKDIREKLDQIDKEKVRFHFNQSGSSGERSRPLTGSDIEEKMIGRIDDKEAVIHRLVSGSSSSDQDGLLELHVIAIVGIGGLGKTTLAREVYHDGRVKSHFDMVLWVCVSEPFDVTALMKAILEVIERKKPDLSQPSAIQDKLHRELEGKRFLLVLDDVWNENKEMWNQLRVPLTRGAPGSTILVTTRVLKVAETVSSRDYIHELKGLSEDDSWRLFSNKAFAGKEHEEYLKLESIGRQIVKKCRGVPLSIKVIGSAMNSKRTVENWKNILDSNMWSLQHVADEILPALLLSYYNLPPYLKQCFTCCWIYKKDTEMKKRELVELWAAEGFIQSQENGDMEAIGNEYFEDLVAWSMFQEVSDDGSSCKMHDLLHDLAEYIMKEETYIYTSEKANPCPTNVRHASISLSPSITPIKSIQAKKLRSLFLDGVENAEVVDLFCHARFLRALRFSSLKIKILPNSMGKLKHLRFLDFSKSWIVELPNAIAEMKHLQYLNLSDSELVELPNAIGKLKHLRYLDLSATRIVKLPDVIGKMKQLRYLDLSQSQIVELTESMSHLANLHTLKLNRCQKLKKLPGNMGRMVSLRHLEMERTDSLEYLPTGLGRIISLRSLSKFIVGGGGGCGIDELQQLNLLEGNLVLQHLERVSYKEEARKAELWNKPHLRKLLLEMEKREEENATTESDAETERINGVLEGLQPHVNLEKLRLDCKRRSSRLPSWMGNSSLSKLTKLEIGGFVQCEVLPGLAKLVALTYLKIRDLRFKKVCNYEVSYGNSGNDVVGRRSEAAFPKLERLVLEDVELEAWELTLEAFLQLWNCSNVEGLPQHLAIFPLLTELHIVRCHGIKGIECSSSFPLLEKFTLNDSSEFFSSELPHLPNLKEFYFEGRRNETLPDGGWELLAALQRLKIRDCNEVKSLPDGLRRLQSLENLMIESCRKLESLPKGLGQLKKLQSLTIDGLEGLSCLPDSLEQLESLENVQIKGCQKLQSLPPKGLEQLKKLKSLEIRGAEALTCLPDSLGQLVSLEDLEMDGLKKLRSLPEGMGQLKKLRSLKIWGAEALTHLPDSLGHLQSLEGLYMDGLKKLQVLPEELGQLKKLKSLEISGDLVALTCLPNWVGQLESLERLTIEGWKKLESVPDRLLGGLKKLESLEIENMEALTCLPDSLEQLESLTIQRCKKLKSLPHGLGPLKELTIFGVPGPALTHPPPPDTLGKLKSSLVYLRIGGWKELESLPHWVRQFKRLKRLYVNDCEALRSVPHWLQDLPLLHYLWIWNCPLLLERCKRPELGGGGGGGEDWPNISRIPIVYIDGQRVR